MIRELADFVLRLSPDFKTLGMKPKEGLHIMLGLQEKGGRIFIDEHSLVQSAFTRSKQHSPDEIQFLKKCAVLNHLSWNVNTNKCFDLPVKAIHSCSPYSVAIKRENLTGGVKYLKNEKTQVFDRISSHYFPNASELLETEEEKQTIHVFEQALNTEGKFNAWLALCPDYNQVKESEYVIFYLDIPIQQYEKTNARYLADKLFNTNDYNKTIGEKVYGTSDFFNGYPTKKPFLTHQSASFDIATRVSADDAKRLFEFSNIISRGILPKPLPVFIHQDEINKKGGRSLEESAISIFMREGDKNERDNRIGYREIIEELYDRHGGELGNYYLLFYDHRGVIKDFDFVPKFELELLHGGEKWRVEDFFNGKNECVIKNVFDIQQTVLFPVFSNGLVVKTKTGGYVYKYFEEIDSKFIKSNVIYLLIMKYRKAFYDFVYKSKRQSITSYMFNDILQSAVIEDLRMDQIENGYHSEDRNIRRKLNIWFSLKEKFSQSLYKNQETMANMLKEHRRFILQLAKGDEDIETDEQYAFAAGQVIYYLMSKSKTVDRSYKRLEPFLQQVQAANLNMAISRMFDSYKHQQFSSNFKNPFSQVLAYTSDRSIREQIPALLSGFFSPNALFSSKEYEEDVAEIQSAEENELT